MDEDGKAFPAELAGGTTTEDLRREIVDGLEYGYGPMLVAVAFAFFLFGADPAHEVILSLALEAATGGIDLEEAIRITASVLLFALVPVAIYVSSTRALDARDKQGPLADRVDRGLTFLASRLPLLGGLAGVLTVATGSEAGRAGGLLFGLAGAIGAVLLLSFLPAGRSLGVVRLRDLVLRYSGAFGLAVLAVAALATAAPGASWRLGPVAVAAAFVIVAAFALSELTRLSARSRSRFPLILLLVALTFAGDDWRVGAGVGGLLIALCLAVNVRRNGGLAMAELPRPVLLIALLFVAAGGLARIDTGCGIASGCNILQGAVAETPPGGSGNGQAAVFDWAETRDWSDPDTPPLRILAAQGGGLYAAYQTAYYLAYRSDTEAEFADSLFAISGVSGGSVGGAVYWAIRRSGVCEDPAAPRADCHRQAVRQILRHDYLSPPLSALLFRDFLDTLFPYTPLIGRPVDRGAVLETAFARRIDTCCSFEGPDGTRSDIDVPDGLLGVSMADSPGAGLPLLFLNSTDVHSGESVIASPLDGLEPSRVRSRVLLDSGNDLTVGEAMLLSARFPVVTPPGRYIEGGETKQVVDGGYFDNSGVETVTELLRGTEFARFQVGAVRGLNRSIPVEILSFRILEDPGARSIRGTVTAPISAFRAAWIARRDLTTGRFCTRFRVNDASRSAITSRESIVQADRVNFTVSWLLTSETFNDIEAQIEAPRELDVAPICPAAGTEQTVGFSLK
nr:patatin-like phospholipase family protein [Roseisalinus antarcticus]